MGLRVVSKAIGSVPGRPRAGPKIHGGRSSAGPAAGLSAPPDNPTIGRPSA